MKYFLMGLLERAFTEICKGALNLRIEKLLEKY